LLYVFNFFKQLNIGIYNYKYIFFDYYKNKIVLLSFVYLLFILSITGDWGLGIGDCAQSPIHNPQSPSKCFICLNLKIN